MVTVPARQCRGGDFFAPARLSAFVNQLLDDLVSQRITALTNQVGFEKAQTQAKALGLVFQERDGQFKIHQPCLLDQLT